LSPSETSGPGAHRASYTTGTWSLLGVKRLGRGVDHPPHLAPRLKKEENYTFTPPLGLRGLLQGELYLRGLLQGELYLRGLLQGELYLYLYLYETLKVMDALVKISACC
jgi:hypothetical protein